MMAPPSHAATFAYVGNAESNEIIVLQLDRQSGDLTAVEKVPIPGITKPGISTPMAVSPDRRILYVGTRGEPQIVAGFAIDPATGKLKHLASGPLPDSMAYIAVPTLGNDSVNQFMFDAATGKLTPNTPPSVRVKEKAGPRHLVFHPNGKIVYVIGELDGAVYVFDYDAATGQLRDKQSVSALPPDFQGKPSAADLHITPDGRFLYGSERTSSTLAGFKVDPATGTLTPIGSVATEKQPRGFNIDSTGRYLLAVGQLSHALSSYRIDPESGKLIKLREYPMGKNPNWVEILGFP
jgi:6-phosphogluconolactonase